MIVEGRFPQRPRTDRGWLDAEMRRAKSRNDAGVRRVLGLPTAEEEAKQEQRDAYAETQRALADDLCGVVRDLRGVNLDETPETPGEAAQRLLAERFGHVTAHTLNYQGDDAA